VADRVFTVLETCAASRRALSLVELVELTGLPKTTLHRVCWKLVELRVLEHVGDGFRVGPRLYALGATSPELHQLRALGMPLLHALVSESGLVANLGVVCDGRALIVDEVYGSVPLARPKMVGATVPLHATAIGKALLANAPDELREEILAAQVLRPFTRNTIVRTSLLREHLDRVRAAGVAVSREEWRLGTAGIAAPVLVGGVAVAALALVGPPDESTLKHFAPRLRSAAARLGSALAPAPELLAA
jgi:DNA-binding IclR family transcriptional regulator